MGQYVSPYIGVGNNPVNGIDPDGGFWQELKNFVMGKGWNTNKALEFMKNNPGYNDLGWKGDRLTGSQSFGTITKDENGREMATITAFKAVQDYKFGGIAVYLDFETKVTIGARMSYFAEGIAGFDANLGNITLTKYSFVDNAFSGILQGDLEYSFGMSGGVGYGTLEVGFGNLRKNGVETERKMSLSGGVFGIVNEYSYDALNKKFASEIKAGGSLGTGLVGEGNLILKIIPLKK
jgi:hypothetical protein